MFLLSNINHKFILGLLVFTTDHNSCKFCFIGKPSPPGLSFPTGQHSQQISQLLQTSHLHNSRPANTYSTHVQTPTILGIQPDETEAVQSITDSAATFLSNFNTDNV